MNDHDPELAGALDALVPSFANTRPDWDDALRRGRRSRGRLAAAAAVAGMVVVALAVAPAFGLGRGALPFLGAEKAPEPIVVDFAELSKDAPVGMDPGVIAHETRKVGVWQFEGKSHTLFVAPTQAGGFCFEWSQAAGGCDKLGAFAVSATGAFAPMRVPPGGDTPQRLEDGIPIWVAGYVRAKYAASAEIRFEDGSVVRPELTWVSEPIGAGFFAYDIPAEHRVSGHRAISVVAVDKHGDAVETDFLGVGAVRDPLVDAVMDKRHAEVELDTAHGPATLYTAPTRYDGECAFVEFEGKRAALYPCIPRAYGFGDLPLSVVPTPDDALLASVLPAKVATVELGFADGDSVTLHVHDYLLYEIPANHLVPAAMLTSLTARDASGERVGPDPPSMWAPGSPPCYRPLPLPAGTDCPGGFSRPS